MPDLDQLLDAFVADVRSETRARGASTAIEQAHRRRRLVAVAGAVAAVAVIAAGTALATGTLGGSEGMSSFAGTPTASPEPRAGQEETSVGERYRTLRRTLTVPGWAFTDAALSRPGVLDACEGNWVGASGGAGHNLGLSVSRDEPPAAIAEEIEGFHSPALASDAMDRLVENLASCPAWGTQPIGQTGAVLAFYDAGVVWIHHKGTSVAWLHVRTTDGPPPLAVQVEVADLIYSWFR
jgi:hypothetical protein